MKRSKLVPRRRETAESSDVEAIGSSEVRECVRAEAESRGGDERVRGGKCEIDYAGVAEDDFDNEIEAIDDEIEVNGLGVDEEALPDLEPLFGAAARNDCNDSDGDSGDDMWNDEKIPDPISSDDDEERYERRVLAANTLESEELLYLGKTFGCADDFKAALLRYSLKTRYDIKMYKSTVKQLGAKCSDLESNCPWKVYCSYERRKRKLHIKVFVNEHVCIRSGYSKLLKRSFIAMLFEERLQLNPKLTKSEMASEMKREYNLIVTDDQCGKAKSKLFRERKASHGAHFSRIWDYQAEILKSNKYSTMEIETIPGPFPQSKQRFDRLYMCFTSQRESWMATCRPIIGLDGAFLKRDIKDHLLAAVGRDGDNRIVPIAWAVVEIENNSNWEWFIKHLKDDLRLENGAKITIISDKQKGLVNAIKNELPEAEHRMCSRHILANWKRDTKDPHLETLFWQIATTYTQGEYADALETLKTYNKGAYDTLQLQNPPTWSRAFFRLGSFCNDHLNNLSESFNRTIKESRKKSLLDMLEDIRRQCMVRNAKRAIIAGRLQTRYTKRVHLEIEQTKEKSKDCVRYIACGNLHEIDHYGVAYRVDMDMKTCGCIKWQLNGIPCVHAACVIVGKKERLGVLPPPFRLGNRGRPSNHDRRKGPNESSSSSNKNKLTREKRIITCSNCHEEGHNKLTCQNQRVENVAKKPRGRPRKDCLGEGPKNITTTISGVITRTITCLRDQVNGLNLCYCSFFKIQV